MRILSNLRSFHEYFTEPTKHDNTFWKVSCSEHTRFVEVDINKMYKQFPKTIPGPLTTFIPKEEFFNYVQKLKLYEVSAKGELYVETDHTHENICFWRITNG